MSEKEEIFAAARKLAETINTSGIYKEYRSSLLKVQEQPALTLRLHAFKEAAAAGRGGEISFDQEKAVSHQYAELTSHPDTAAFLAGEGEFLEVYSGVLDIIDEACEMEIF